MRRRSTVGGLSVLLVLCMIPPVSAAPQDPAKPAAQTDAAPPAQTEYTGGGFRMTSGDGRFSLRLTAGAQVRYSYVEYDEGVEGNAEDYSNFFLRRARVWLDGHAYGPKLTYVFQIQLEPQSAVNLYDGWINYAFAPLFQVGLGRNKIAYGFEYLVSAFSNNFIDRSILSGETDISSGGGFSRWPGGGTEPFPTSAEDGDTGFPVGGLVLFRSQGVQVSGRSSGTGPAFEYQAGIWQGRNTRGASNPDAHHLYAVRAAFYPNGPANPQYGGDVADTPTLKTGFIASVYADTTRHDANSAGAAVSLYDAKDRGFDLGFLARYRGFSADLEWAAERFELEDASLAGDREFDRRAWRVQAGYFLRPKRVEIVGRHVEVQRLKDPAYFAARNSGLGFAKVRGGDGFTEAAEKKLTETTLGVNCYLAGAGHQHKIFVDYSRLARSFAGFVAGTTLAGSVPAQTDHRLRTMLQLRF